MHVLARAASRCHPSLDPIDSSEREGQALDLRAANLALLTTATTSAREEVWQTAQAYGAAATRESGGGDNALTAWAESGIATARAAAVRLFGADDPIVLDLHGSPYRPG